MSAAILAVNAGSSSLKFALFAGDSTACLARGEVAGLHGPAPRLTTQRAGQAPESQALGGSADAESALRGMLDWLDAHFPHVPLCAIGHRVVHGGMRFTAPVVVDDAMLDDLEALDPLAPQHQPHNLAALRALRDRFPDALPVACFDTAFHAGWDDAAARIALPRRFHDAGIRRYGFHGLSYQYLGTRVRTLAPGATRVVLAHLGSGASLCALRDGRSIDCTMGFSVLDGLPMATRCGAIDPGVIFHLHRRHALGFKQIERMLYYDSGLKGVSGSSADMRELCASPRPEARQAVELFTRHCVSAVGAMSAVLGGLDAMLFSGGIGAHAAEVRAAICAPLQFLGVQIDAAANRANRECVSAASSRVPVFALQTDEESMIAAHCRALLAAGAAADPMRTAGGTR